MTDAARLGVGPKQVNKVNREEDLGRLVAGDIVQVYFGHNYGELFKESKQMRFVACREGRTIILGLQNQEGAIRLRLDHASYRDGVLVHPLEYISEEEMYNKLEL